MKQNINEIQIKITDFTKNGKCSNCGECCTRFLPISSKEKKEIIRYLEKHDISLTLFSFPYNFDQSLVLLCPFRDDGYKKCLIYPVRPSICKNTICSDPDVSIKQKNLLVKRYSIVDMMELLEEFLSNKNKRPK